MTNAILFFTELFVLFLISRRLTLYLSLFFHKITRSKKATVYLLAFLFFPGTVIHELAHAVTATLLGIRVTAIHLLPRIEGENVKLGTVTMVKPDIFRNLLVGMAPFFTGTIILLCTFYLASAYHLFNNYLLDILIGYIVFEVGNTMFSSKKDMEGAIELLLALVIIAAICYFFGLRLPSFDPAVFFSQPLIQQVFEKGTVFLIAPLAIDAGIILLLRTIV